MVEMLHACNRRWKHVLTNLGEKKMRNTKTLAILAIAIIATVQLIQTPNTYAAQTTAPEKALNSMSDILGLDLSKYSVKLYNNFSGPSEIYKGLTKDDIAYTLESTDSRLFVLVRFVNSALFYMDMQILDGSPSAIHYSKQLSTDPIAATKTLLTRVQTATNAPILSDMQNLFERTTDVPTANKTVGNLKCQATVHTININSTSTSTSTSIYFMYAFNGADSPKSISFHYQDGVLRNFADTWNIFTVGNENIKVTREQAIEIARTDASNSSSNPLNFTSIRPVTASLHMVVREKQTIYPFWFVELPLDYANSTINGWQEGVWADTGEIAFGHPTGMLGSMPDLNNQLSNSQTTQPPASSDATQNDENNYIPIIAAVSATILVLGLVAIVLKKRTK